MKHIAVVDTETNWNNRVMSIGVVIATTIDYQMVDSRYYVIQPEYQVGGMYSQSLFIESAKKPIIGSRQVIIERIKKVLKRYSVNCLLAYNASFDMNHLQELILYRWLDIMKIGAYRQFNSKISEHADCCNTGRLRRNYGVESIYRMLSGTYYSEKHNALTDAIDELKIMEMLGHSIGVYIRNAEI
ncbi:MAG: hypothetical protein J6M24_06355 [Lachnospiraceae bacterium]|nr:hypothetical protein [Lachnospiraceae bacterium]